jgi:hypothetical protein
VVMFGRLSILTSCPIYRDHYKYPLDNSTVEKIEPTLAEPRLAWSIKNPQKNYIVAKHKSNIYRIYDSINSEVLLFDSDFAQRLNTKKFPDDLRVIFNRKFEDEPLAVDVQALPTEWVLYPINPEQSYQAYTVKSHKSQNGEYDLSVHTGWVDTLGRVIADETVTESIPYKKFASASKLYFSEGEIPDDLKQQLQLGKDSSFAKQWRIFKQDKSSYLLSFERGKGFSLFENKNWGTVFLFKMVPIFDALLEQNVHESLKPLSNDLLNVFAQNGFSLPKTKYIVTSEGSTKNGDRQWSIQEEGNTDKSKYIINFEEEVGFVVHRQVNGVVNRLFDLKGEEALCFESLSFERDLKEVLKKKGLVEEQLDIHEEWVIVDPTQQRSFVIRLNKNTQQFDLIDSHSPNNLSAESLKELVADVLPAQSIDKLLEVRDRLQKRQQLQVTLPIRFG